MVTSDIIIKFNEGHSGSHIYILTKYICMKINSSMCKYAVNYYQINCPLCFLLILIKMDTRSSILGTDHLTCKGVMVFYFVQNFYSLQKRCSLYVLNMILETPNFKVTNIIFERYEHRSKIILQLLTSFVFLKVGFVPHRRIHS